MMTTKLNDRLEFPDTISLQPFTKEHLGHPDFGAGQGQGQGAKDDAAKDDSAYVPAPYQPDWYYQYELKGVVVHAGRRQHPCIHASVYLPMYVARQTGNHAYGHTYIFHIPT